jgi:hypothetical protein
VWVLALEAFDEVGELGRDGARLAAVLARLRRERLETAVAIAQCPVQQRVHGNRRALGSGDLVLAGGDLLGAASQFAAGQCFQN